MDIELVNIKSVKVPFANGATLVGMGLTIDSKLQSLSLHNIGSTNVHFDVGGVNMAAPGDTTPSSPVLGVGEGITLEVTPITAKKLTFHSDGAAGYMNVEQKGGDTQ